MSAITPSPGSKRLDSWKEIAAFFGRDERTVSRWEKDLGLPVHRLPGAKGRVYAYADELAAWLAAPKNAEVVAPTIPAGLTLVETGPTSTDAGVSDGPTVEKRSPSGAGRSRTAYRLAAVAILGVGAMALVLFHPGASRVPKTAEHPISSPRPSTPNAVVLASTQSHDPEAEQLYLKGRYYWNKRTPEDLSKALDYFMQAVVHDPNYSQAYVGLADCYSLMREYTLMPSSEAYPRALAAAKKAVELDEQSSEAHASLAFVSFFGMWDVATGEREFRRSIDLDPNRATSHQWYANALLALHRLPEALTEIDRAQALDPASTSILADKGNILSGAGRHEAALTLLKQVESREPSFRSPHLYLKGAYLRTQDYPDYIAELKKDAVLVRDDSALAVATAAEKGFASGGAHGMWEATLQVQKKLYAQHQLSPTVLAQTFAMLGNKEEALRYLQAAFDQHDGQLLFVKVYSEFAGLHDEPAYRDLLARLNLPVENAESAPSNP